MTLRALFGLFALNAFVLAVGCALLWGIRGWRVWVDLVRLGGVAYLLGLAALVVTFTVELVAGVPFGFWSIVLTGVALAACGLLVGRRHGHPLPSLARRVRLGRPSLVVGIFSAAIVLYFQGFFRAGRLEGPGPDWDAWRAWTLRAKSIYDEGGLDPSLPSVGQTPSYPPGLSAAQAAAFHAMGSADAVTLHLLTWFPAAGFVAALIGLLTPRVRSVILLPFVLLLLLVPQGILEWGSRLMADLPMGFLLAVAALLVVLWLEDRQTWRLPAAALLLAGAMLTKREGQLFAAIIVVSALAASWRDRRTAWPGLGAVATAAFVLALPWRIWFTTKGLPSDAPEAGYLGFLYDLDRGWASLRLVVSTLFAPDFWLLVPALALAACALCLLAGEGRLPTFVLSVLVLSAVGSTWVIWTNPTFEITRDYALNPVGRLGGTVVLVVGALTPLLLDRAWSATRTGTATPSRPGAVGHRQAAVAWAIILIAAFGYPVSMVTGTAAFRLPGGPPPFPSPDECVVPPNDGRVVVVLGYAGSYANAFRLRARASSAGLRGASIEHDGCGRLRVFLGPFPRERGQLLVEQATDAGLSAALEGAAQAGTERTSVPWANSAYRDS